VVAIVSIARVDDVSTRDTTWPPGTPCWADLNTSDPDPAVAFYAALFGWTVDGAGAAHYAIASLDGRPVVGINRVVVDHPPAWTTYLATDDLIATSAAVAGAGGNVLLGPMDAGGAGRMALVDAGAGGFLGLWQGGELPGFGRVDEPGAVIWTELLATDYDAAKDFYGAVFDIELAEIGNENFRFSTIAVEGNVVGGIGATGDRTRWRLYFGSADPDATMADAVRLGGRVVDAAHDSPFGRWGTVADPQGAQFSVITAPDAS
jgi:predicted enzyme related to lactoylglutathione lyase